MHGVRVSIAIPASVVSDTPHLREKTSKIGLIGRAAAIFRVDEIIVYPDDPKTDQTKEMDLIALQLSYMETPQYLRKRLFKLKPELEYAGILPPLRTPHHPLGCRSRTLKLGEIREGVVLSKIREGSLVDIGIEQPALIANMQMPTDRRVTVKVIKIAKQVEVEIANASEIREYWGYLVTVERQHLGKLLKKRRYDLVIATSKYGVPLPNVSEEISGRWKKAATVLVAFGAPSQGLHRIVSLEGQNLNELVDFVVNTIPVQGTETVRTEEALIATLSVLNSCVFKT